MKPAAPLRPVAFAFATLLAAASASTQEDELVTVYFHATGQSTYANEYPYDAPDTGTLAASIPESKTVADPSVYARTQVSQATVADAITTPWTELRVEVGRIYHVTISATNVIYGSSHFEMKTPPGYYWESVNQTGPYYPGTHMFRVMPDNVDSAPRRAGQAGHLVSGRTSWGVSLGSRGNGTSAGSIRLIDVGFESSWNGVYTPAGLKIFSRLPVYDTPSGASSPYVVGAPRQMKTPEAMVDIVPLSGTEYELRFYDASAFSETDYPYSVSGKSPYVVYNVKKPGGSSTELQITKTAGSRTEVTSISRSGSWPDYTWTVNDWNKSGASQLVQTVDAWGGVSGSNYTSSAILRNPTTSATAAESLRTLYRYAWGEAPYAVRTGPSGDNLTTSYAYYENDTDPDSYSRVKSVTYPSDAWEGYEYYGVGENGMAGGGFRVHRPFLNSPSSVPSDLSSNTSGEISKYWFAERNFSDQRPLRLEKVERTINGTLMAKTEFSYYDPVNASTFGANGRALVRATRYDWTENDSNKRLKTVTRYYNGTNDGLAGDQVFSIERPDKSKTVFAYHAGTWSSGSFAAGTGSATRIAVIQGTTDTSVGAAAPAYDSYDLTSANDSETDVFRLVAGRSTMETTVRNSRAQIVQRQSLVWDGDSWELLSTETFTYNTAGFLTEHVAGNGAQYTATYDGELKTSETDATGVVTSSGTSDYDAAGRVASSTRAGAGGSPDPVPAVTTTYGYDAAGRLRTRTSGSSPSATYTWNFDTAGRPTEAKIPGPNGADITTGYAYASLSSGYSRTVTFPHASTRIETYHPDGRLASVTGTGVVHRYFDYGLDGGRHKTTAYAGSSGNSRRTETWTDWLGRTTKTSQPGFAPTSQPASVGESFYDGTTGQLKRSTRTGYADTLYEYDGLGRLRRSGLDVSASQTLTDGSLDRVTETEMAIEPFDGAWWLRETAYAFFDDNSATKTRVSTTRTRLSGFGGNLRAETRFWNGDYADNSTTSQTSRNLVEIDRSAKTVTRTAQLAGVGTDAVSTVLNGRLRTARGHDNVTHTHAYDGLLRRSKSTDPRTGDTTFTYKAGTALLYQVTSPASTVVGHEYDNQGRLVARIDEAGKYARTAYDDLGRAHRRWGDAVQPVEYGFDATYGDPTTTTTYRAGTGWTGSSWPGSPGTADPTTTAYDAASGLPSSRTFADSTAVTFQYNAAGQLSRRTWSRGVYADYGYSSATGELTGIDYSDSTPDVSYTYTRAGQLKTAGDTATGATTFAYDSAKPWRLDREELPAYLGSRWISPQYETSGLVGRAAGFQLGTSGDRDADLKQDWTYESSTGRLDQVLAAAQGGSARTFDYGYVSNSSLLHTLSITNPGGGASPFSVSRGYEANRNLLTSIAASWSGTGTVAQFEYQYDDLGRRDWEKRSGTSFALDGLKVSVDYQYNDRGELTRALSYRGESWAAADQLPNLQHEYGYDNAGNRTSANQTVDAGRIDSFTVNNLNQVTACDHKSVIVSGTVGNAAAVIVSANGGAPAAADRQGSYWSRALTPGNASAPDSADLSIVAGTGTGAVRTESRTAYVGQASQAISRDNDGNTTGDGLWTYEWDGENRLIRATATSAAVTAGFPNRKLEFAYDHAGRRVQKVVYTWNGSAWTVQAARRFIYDGWNLVGEYDAPGGTSFGGLKRTFTWGLDLAGSLSATGGNGALLQIQDHDAGKTYFPAYDGNGNVMALYDSADGAAAAVYEYSPFGELLKAEGAYATSNPFRFSTKFTDDETGLVYYGHRYYSSSLGRFINRDPIGESGGLNLYAMAGNDPVNGFDVLGLNADWLPEPWPAPWGGTDYIDGDSGRLGFVFGRSVIWGSLEHTLLAAMETSLRDEVIAQARAESQAAYDRNAALGREIDRRLVYRPAIMERMVFRHSGSQAGTMPVSLMGADRVRYANDTLYTDADEAALKITPPESLVLGTLRQMGEDLLWGVGKDIELLEQHILTPMDDAIDAVGSGAGYVADQLLPGTGQGVKNVIVVGSIFIGPGELRPAAKAVAGARTAAESTAVRGGVGPVLQGQAGVARAVGQIEGQGGTILGREITLEAGAVRTRPDLLVRTADGRTIFVEVKNGAGATLTPNQAAGFPVIEAGGAVPRGANAAAAGLPVGQPLPPTPVQVIHYP